MTRVVCDANSFGNVDDSETKLPDSPVTSTYIERSYYQYKVLWRWPFYVLAGCISALWLVCMIAMWIAPESRVLAIDWLLSQYIAKQQYGYRSGQELLQAHQDVNYQIFDRNANGDVGNIVISTTESRKLDRYDKVVQDKQYQ
ncbi:unnamed protein product [Mucor circinelloides]